MDHHALSHHRRDLLEILRCCSIVRWDSIIGAKSFLVESRTSRFALVSDESNRVGTVHFSRFPRKKNLTKRHHCIISMDHGDRVHRRIYRIDCTFNLPCLKTSLEQLRAYNEQAHCSSLGQGSQVRASCDE